MSGLSLLRLGWTARLRKSGEQWLAQIGMASATILHQKNHQLTQPAEIGTIDDGAALPDAFYQARARQHIEMRGQGVLGDAQESREFTGRNPVRLMRNKGPKCLKASGLRQSS